MHQNNVAPTLTVDPSTFSKRLFFIAVVLMLLNLCGIYFKKVVQVDNFVSNALVFFFDASAEANVPTYFSSLILFIAAATLYIIYRTTPKGDGKVLMIIFALLSVDETASIHEQFGKIAKTFHFQSDYFYYSWIIPYLVFAVIAFFFFLKFLLKLPVKTRMLFIVSGIVYTGAATCFELFEGKIAKHYGSNTLNELWLSAAEEFLEMTGVIIFIYALLKYAAATNPSLTLSFTSGKDQTQ
jgi:hypothetical protein